MSIRINENTRKCTDDKKKLYSITFYLSAFLRFVDLVGIPGTFMFIFTPPRLGACSTAIRSGAGAATCVRTSPSASDFLLLPPDFFEPTGEAGSTGGSGGACTSSKNAVERLPSSISALAPSGPSGPPSRPKLRKRYMSSKSSVVEGGLDTGSGKWRLEGSMEIGGERPR